VRQQQLREPILVGYEMINEYGSLPEFITEPKRYESFSIL